MSKGVEDLQMNKIIYDEFKKIMSEELRTQDLQKDLHKCVVEGPAEQYERVKGQEDNPSNVEKRMLTESSILSQEKLRYDGKNLDIDWKAHDKASRRKKQW